MSRGILKFVENEAEVQANPGFFVENSRDSVPGADDIHLGFKNLVRRYSLILESNLVDEVASPHV